MRAAQKGAPCIGPERADFAAHPRRTGCSPALRGLRLARSRWRKNWSPGCRHRPRSVSDCSESRSWGWTVAGSHFGECSSARSSSASSFPPSCTTTLGAACTIVRSAVSRPGQDARSSGPESSSGGLMSLDNLELAIAYVNSDLIFHGAHNHCDRGPSPDRGSTHCSPR